MSLRDIFMEDLKSENNVESYIMKSFQQYSETAMAEEGKDNKTLVVTRLGVVFGGSECELFSFKNITTFAHLKEEKTKNNLLKMLHTSVSHDMVGTLGSITELAELLYG